jgi:Chlorophyll A-B binding protein
MKFVLVSVLMSSAAAFVPIAKSARYSSSFNAFAVCFRVPAVMHATVKSHFVVESLQKESMVGALAPMGFFDPMGLATKADVNTIKCYRKAGVTHGRVAMLAAVGFLVGEAVEGSSFLFDASIQGPAITHLAQVPVLFWVMLTVAIGASEQNRAEHGWVDPADVPVDQPGLLKSDYVPGNLGFDPMRLKPDDPTEYAEMQTKELQNGCLAMLATAGFMAQELVNGKGIVENLVS